MIKLDIRIAEDGDDWTCSMLLPEEVIILSVPSYVWDEYGCVVSELTSNDYLMEIVPLIPWVVNSITWESTLMAVYNVNPELSDSLDDWQINYLDAYRVFNFNGRFIYFEDRAWEILSKKKVEMNKE